MFAPDLKSLCFDLAYLACLTREGVKPLSRWEKGFDRETERVLHDMGLQTRSVERSTRSGRVIRELVFSRSEQCLALYVKRFGNRPVNHSRPDRRIEGLLFGYPMCCVESFVANGYARNSLRRADQKILFHWACPDCAMTPVLLPYYRRIHRECRRLIRHGAGRASAGGCDLAFRDCFGLSNNR